MWGMAADVGATAGTQCIAGSFFRSVLTLPPSCAQPERYGCIWRCATYENRTCAILWPGSDRPAMVLVLVVRPLHDPFGVAIKTIPLAFVVLPHTSNVQMHSNWSRSVLAEIGFGYCSIHRIGCFKGLPDGWVAGAAECGRGQPAGPASACAEWWQSKKTPLSSALHPRAGFVPANVALARMEAPVVGDIPELV